MQELVVESERFAFEDCIHREKWNEEFILKVSMKVGIIPLSQHLSYAKPCQHFVQSMIIVERHFPCSLLDAI